MRAKRTKVHATQRGGRTRNEGYYNVFRKEGADGGRQALPSFREEGTANRTQRTCQGPDHLPIATLRRFGLVLRPLAGGQVQRLDRCDLRLRDGPDSEPIVRVQLRDSDGI